MTDTAQCERCGAPVQVGSLFCARCGVDVTQSTDADETVVTTGGTPVEGPTRSTMRSMLREATLGEYEILDELGRGGMATVFRAHDISLDRKVAIKVMSPHLLEGEGMAERFKLEARTAAQLSHPHIIPIYAVKESAATLFFVMKYVEGRALDEIIARTGQLPMAMVKDILIKVGGALGYAHRRGVVHRDIKPGNIMIDEEGTPIVTDFGIAKVTESTGLTITGTTIGTPSYMSPEQCEAKEVTGASDQYSLGVVAFQMLTGRLPFEGDSAVTVMYKHCHEELPPLEDYRPDCPSDVLETVKRMVAKAPGERWPSMEAAIQKLSLGGSSEAYLDPIREELVKAAKEGDFQRLAELSTGGGSLSAVGAAGDSGSHGSTPATGGSRGAMGLGTGAEGGSFGRRRMARVAAVAVLVVVGGSVAVLQPWSSGTSQGEDVLQAGDPSAQPDAGPAEGDAGPGGSADPEQLAGAAGGLANEAEADEPGSLGGGESDSGVPTGVDGSREIAAPAQGPGGGVEPSRVVVDRVTLSGVPGTLDVGRSVRIDATALDGTGDAIPAGVVERCQTHGWAACGVLWSSDAPGVATVSDDGLVTAVAPGTALIYATIGGQRGAAEVSVSEPSAAAVSLSPPSLRLTVGDRERLEAQAQDASGAPLRGNRVIWSSEDEGVARVGPNGAVEAVGPGTTTVVAQVDGLRATAEVTVGVDPRTAVQGLVDAFAAALEAEDLATMRRLFPGMSSDAAEGFRSFFQAVEGLQVQLAVDAMEAAADSATAVLRGTYVFDDRVAGEQRIEVVLNAGFAAGPGGEWLITGWEQIED